jgi:hypothetical protein
MSSARRARSNCANDCFAIAETAKKAEEEEVARANTDAVFEFACQVNCHEIFARMDR